MYKIIDCTMNMPSESHEFTENYQYGCWDKRGFGLMKYRECLKCGIIEYSMFTSDDGKTEDIDEIYRSKNETQ